MKNIWFAFWREFLLFFRNPREIHRVVLTVPLSGLLSHVIYMYNLLPPEYIFTTADITAIWLGVSLYIMTLMWCFLSNEMTIDLFNRFAIVASLTVLYHRVYFYTIDLGDPYYQALSTISFLVFVVWAITGKSYKDFKHLYIEPAVKKISGIFIKNEKKADIHVIHRDGAINE